jgi:hypothetical protein
MFERPIAKPWQRKVGGQQHDGGKRRQQRQRNRMPRRQRCRRNGHGHPACEVQQRSKLKDVVGKQHRRQTRRQPVASWKAHREKNIEPR